MLHLQNVNKLTKKNETLRNLCSEMELKLADSIKFKSCVRLLNEKYEEFKKNINFLIKKKDNVIVISEREQKIIDKMKDFQQSFQCYQTQLNQCAQRIQKKQNYLENQINQKLHNLSFFFFKLKKKKTNVQKKNFQTLRKFAIIQL